LWAGFLELIAVHFRAFRGRNQLYFSVYKSHRFHRVLRTRASRFSVRRQHGSIEGRILTGTAESALQQSAL
jgi:hypothetical protein